MATTELQVVHDEHSQAPAPRDRGMLSSQDVLARVTRIAEIMKSVMSEGTHFGRIPGTPKPTLLKPGAEKLLMTFQIAAEPRQIVDLSTADEARFRVLVAGVSQATGTVLGEAWGECSSNEEKYRWRKPVCDQEFDETPLDQRREVWKRAGDRGVQKQKQVRTSPADVSNTILQMATKRGLIPMTRVVLACSDIFEQDLEDMPEQLRESLLEEGKPALQAPQRKSDQQNGKAAPPASSTSLPDGAVLVTKTDSREGEKDGRKWVLFTIYFSDGKVAGTFDTNLAAVADMAKDAKRPMWPVLEPGKKPGIYKLASFKTPPAAPTAPTANVPSPEATTTTAATTNTPPASTTEPSEPISAEDIPWS